MMSKLLGAMFEEKHDFYEYLDMYEECSDTTIKTKIYSIMEQESHHYKDLMDIIFKEDPNQSWTHMEKAIHKYAVQWYDDMVDVLKTNK